MANKKIPPMARGALETIPPIARGAIKAAPPVPPMARYPVGIVTAKEAIPEPTPEPVKEEPTPGPITDPTQFLITYAEPSESLKLKTITEVTPKLGFTTESFERRKKAESKFQQQTLLAQQSLHPKHQAEFRERFVKGGQIEDTEGALQFLLVHTSPTVSSNLQSSIGQLESSPLEHSPESIRRLEASQQKAIEQAYQSLTPEEKEKFAEEFPELITYVKTPEQIAFETEREAIRGRITGTPEERLAELTRFVSGVFIEPGTFLRTTAQVIKGEPEAGERILDILAGQSIQFKGKGVPELFMESYKPGGFGFTATIAALTVGVGKAGLPLLAAKGTGGAILAKGVPLAIGGGFAAVAGAEIGKTFALEEAKQLPPGAGYESAFVYGGHFALFIGTGTIATKGTPTQILPKKTPLSLFEKPQFTKIWAASKATAFKIRFKLSKITGLPVFGSEKGMIGPEPGKWKDPMPPYGIIRETGTQVFTKKVPVKYPGKGYYLEYEQTSKIELPVYGEWELVPEMRAVSKITGFGRYFQPDIPGEYVVGHIGKPAFIGYNEAYDTFIGKVKTLGMKDTIAYAEGKIRLMDIPTFTTRVTPALRTGPLISEHPLFADYVPSGDFYKFISFEAVSGAARPTITGTTGIGRTTELYTLHGKFKGYKIEVSRYGTIGKTITPQGQIRFTGKGTIYDLTEWFMPKGEGVTPTGIKDITTSVHMRVFQGLQMPVQPRVSLTAKSILTSLSGGLRSTGVSAMQTPQISKTVITSQIYTPSLLSVEKISTKQITEPITEIMIKSMTRNINKLLSETITRPITEIIAKPVTKTVIETITKPTTKQVTKPITETITKPITETITKPVTKTITKTITETITKQITKPITMTITYPIFRPIIKTITHPITEPIIEKPYSPKILWLWSSQPLEEIKRVERGQGYAVLVKERYIFAGKKKKPERYSRVKIHPLSERDAFAFGEYLTDQSVSRSFKIIKVEGKPKPLGFDIPTGMGYKFYKKDDVYIENVLFAIDSPSEFEGITHKGILASMKRRKKAPVSTKKPRVSREVRVSKGIYDVDFSQPSIDFNKNLRDFERLFRRFDYGF